MKKALFFTFAMLLVSATMAQTRSILLEELFNGPTMPPGWYIAEEGTESWSISPSTFAGGNPNEIELMWYPSFNGTSRLVSPAIDLTGISSVGFSFKHALDNFEGVHTIGIATSSNGGATWNEAWSQSYDTSGTWDINVLINTFDMGQPNVCFCLFYNGDSFNINNWYFDNIYIYTVEELDLGIDSSTIPDHISSGETTFGMLVFNYGTTPVTSVEASYQVEGKSPVTETFEVEIPFLEYDTLYFSTPTLLLPNTYNVAYSIHLVNGMEDEDPNNNTFEAPVGVTISATERFPMIEHFSSSTCGPCTAVSTDMYYFCLDNPGRYTYTSYQMNWPVPGDSYYTEEGGIRRDYYVVDAIPNIFLDGENQGFSAINQDVFDLHAHNTAYMGIRGSFEVDGSIITVKVDVNPYIDVTARVFVSVNEKETHGNVGNNGETDFRHVFMKMLPDAEGTTVNFIATQPEHLQFSYDMASTHVEEMGDLEVAIWVQDYASHTIFNSNYAYEYTYHPLPVENLLLVEDVSGAEELLVASWDAPTINKPYTYRIIVNGEIVEENYNQTTYSFPTVYGAFYVVEVQVVYTESGNTSIKRIASKTCTMGIENHTTGRCKLYPNPANTAVHIEAENDIESVKVYNMMGALVQTIPANGNAININTANLSNGIYFLSIRYSDGQVSNQRVVVTH